MFNIQGEGSAVIINSIAVMQPYFFPYIGYFQLINSVDLFVSFDDVNFIKKGWIHRNRILLNGSDHQISLPIQKMSQNKKINESFIFEPKKEKDLLVNLIEVAYRKKAQYFEENFEFIKSLILIDDENIAVYNTNILKKLSAYLNIRTNFVYSSQLPVDNSLTGQDRIMAIVKFFGARRYVNAAGGSELYNANYFSSQNIRLEFVSVLPLSYVQGADQFIPNLSIIDALFFMGRSKLTSLIKNYSTQNYV